MEVFRSAILLLYVYWAIGTVTCTPYEAGEPLLLTPFINAGKLDEARKLSRVEPLLDKIESYSGFLTVNATTKSHQFFWFFSKTDSVNATIAPVVLWLGGGPGSSSLLGLFTSATPLDVVQCGNSTCLRRRAHAWTDDYHMLFIDQPVDTGFSFTEGDGYVNSSAEAAEQLYTALAQFFTLFAEFSQNNFYLAGESYAGKYIPAIGRKIHEANRRLAADREPDHINLRGMIIGNGFTDPENMLDFDQLLHGVGLIYKSEMEALRRMQDKIRYHIRSGNWLAAYDHYWQLVNNTLASINSTNYYDYRSVDAYINITYPSFVQQDWVRKRIHVGSTKFASISSTVARNFRADFPQSVLPWVEELIEFYPFLFYNGIFDIVCSPLFTENYLDKLHWSGAMAFSQAAKQILRIDDQLVGYFKVGYNLLFVTVRNAGHSATIDETEKTRKLIRAFIERSTSLSKSGSVNFALSYTSKSTNG